MMKNLINTELCDMLGIEYPVILAGMGNVSGPTLAAAVSNAGGLGVMGTTQLEPEGITEWINKARSLTDKPFGVDLLMPSSVLETGDTVEVKLEIPAEQTALVNQLKKDFGVSEDAKGMQWAMSPDFARRQVQVVIDGHPDVFAAGLGTPEWVISEMHSHGIKVISAIGNVKSALSVKEAGADIIVAQGHEAGGHTGRIGTFALVPQVVDAVSPTPVVAAGGIGDGRGLAAALALGAVGVWVGTAFLATSEAGVDVYGMGFFDEKFVNYLKERLVTSTEEDTQVTRVYTGKTARVIKSELMRRWEESGVPTLPMPLQWLAIADLLQGLAEQGKYENMALLAGQITGMIKEVKSAKQLVEEMVEDAINILKVR